ncbi:ABC transporter permease [Allorhizobium sp. BGMRC 0089]|uniref:ABC transporter permease n=1 Tax=Allorhizobium sonneratiae TaxID=2934936 RepID=UPI00203476C1|nr:ABC transporter permease [Allorhizobium sonneratiae]MCM2293086.1 ABC transporter permease [Allorhizobium sonneratiae]
MVVASQWALIWHKFRRHRLAMAGLTVVLLIYTVALFAEIIAPSLPGTFKPQYTFAPPQPISLFHDGHFLPHVEGYKSVVDMKSYSRVYKVDETKIIPIGLFVRGEPYSFWGLFDSDIHLIGPLESNQPFYLLGADRLGRDLLTRLIYGTRISMSIGLIGVALSLVIGMALGGISGYFGGVIDSAIQRVIEFLRSIPTIPLWLGLAAAMPKDWSSLKVYFVILVILSLIGWTEMARVVRGRFLSLRTEDFVIAARLDGVSEFRVIARHMMPSFTSHIIAAATLAIPNMILAETSLSFLGLGLQPPIVSWGVLLQDAQNLRALTQAPWLLAPGVAVIVAVLALNFLGDGLRDAADPYA